MELAEGAELPQLKTTPDRYLPVRYAGASGDFDPIHVDAEFATAVGLPGCVLHQLFAMALVARCVTRAAGGSASLERLSVQFGALGVPEREITVTGTVVQVTDDMATIRAKATQGGEAIVREAEADLALP